jgi:hypothetical protein
VYVPLCSQDELSYVGFFDVDDLLVSRNASYFDVKGFLEQETRARPECGLFKAAWMHVPIDEEDIKAPTWEGRPGLPPLAERLRERPVECLRYQAKILANPAAVTNMEIHFAGMVHGFEWCHVPLATLHARWLSGTGTGDWVCYEHLSAGARAFQVASSLNCSNLLCDKIGRKHCLATPQM